MPGPAPNPNVRRRNKSSEWTTLGASTRKPPKLPGRMWLAASREAWATWWASPMASQWLDADVPLLLVAIRCYDMLLRTGDPKFTAELRQLGDRFGLHPLGRQRNRWHVPEEDESAERAAATVTKLRAV